MHNPKLLNMQMVLLLTVSLVCHVCLLSLYIDFDFDSTITVNLCLRTT